MQTTVRTFASSAIVLTGICCISARMFADPPAQTNSTKSQPTEKTEPTDETGPETESTPPVKTPVEGSSPKKEEGKEQPLTIDEARKRARLTHNIYSVTLDVIHHRYFRNDRSTIPARAMEEVFSEISREENINAKWISVNTRAMSIDHEPEDDFEKQAAKVLGTGKEVYEDVVDGKYRRAQSISLMNRGCLGCHLGFGATTKIDRFAGLVITIPVANQK